ncbi:MAG: GAF domain-containing protein [Chloroflexi bacterium]|nr:GAF domain-containing protein [Chloroflexota bacterium]
MSVIALTPEAILEGSVTLTRLALQATSEAAVADAIVRIAGGLIGANQAALGLVRDGEIITVAALMPPRSPIGSHFPVGFGVAGWVAATGRPAEIEDVRQDKRYVALPYPEVRSFVGVPLASGGELLGVLSLAAWRPGAFAPHTADALAPFAQTAALLLRHAADDEQARLRLELLEHAAREGLAESLHELKAPLHAAAGFLEIVVSEQTGPLNAQQKDFLQTARDECLRLKDVLATLVEVGASSEHRPLQLSLVEPGELVEASLQRVRGQATGRQVHLVGEIDPRALSVRADRVAVLQVLANFLQNALGVVPTGSEITVGATAKPGWTHFTVADRGPGVAEYQLESIFDRFAQGEARDADRAAGQVGLGLAISRRIVEQHQGQIWAENRLDGGARFCFALPTAA